MAYVLERLKRPIGDTDDIKRLLDKEFPVIMCVFKKYSTLKDPADPSSDFLRYMIPLKPFPTLQFMAIQQELGYLGYHLRYFETGEEARLYWETGRKDANGKSVIPNIEYCFRKNS